MTNQDFKSIESLLKMDSIDFYTQYDLFAEKVSIEKEQYSKIKNS